MAGTSAGACTIIAAGRCHNREAASRRTQPRKLSRQEEARAEGRSHGILVYRDGEPVGGASMDRAEELPRIDDDPNYRGLAPPNRSGSGGSRVSLWISAIGDRVSGACVEGGAGVDQESRAADWLRAILSRIGEALHLVTFRPTEQFPCFASKDSSEWRRLGTRNVLMRTNRLTECQSAVPMTRASLTA